LPLFATHPDRKNYPVWQIFEVNSSIGKLWDLLGHFDENNNIDFDRKPFLLNYSIILNMQTTIMPFLPKLV